MVLTLMKGSEAIAEAAIRAGARVITSSRLGVSLEQEDISCCAGAMVPAVIINVICGAPT